MRRCAGCKALIQIIPGEMDIMPAVRGRKTRRDKADVTPTISQSEAFMNCLPLRFAFAGCWVTLRLSDGGRLESDVKRETQADPLPDALRSSWPMSPRKSAQIRKFLDYFLKQPIGARIIALGKGHEKNVAWGTKLNESFFAWRDLELSPLDEHGRLDHPVNCIAYNEEQQRCSRLTRNPSGLCGSHIGPGVLTLWNHFPGMADLEVPEEWAFPKTGQP